jgi:PhnB protein
MLACTPFLLFDGNCAEAMTFYAVCLGGELSLTRLGDTPMKAQFPPETHSRIVNAHLKRGAIELSATDWLDSNLAPIQGNTMGIYIVGGSYNELSEVFDKLSIGANKTNFVALVDMPFGSYGHFYDKFGVSWFFKGDKRTQ